MGDLKMIVAQRKKPNKQIILLIGLILFNFFTLNHMRKQDKKSESIEMFPIEVEKE